MNRKVLLFLLVLLNLAGIAILVFHTPQKQVEVWVPCSGRDTEPYAPLKICLKKGDDKKKRLIPKNLIYPGKEGYFNEEDLKRLAKQGIYIGESTSNEVKK